MLSEPVDCPEAMREMVENGVWVKTKEELFYPTGAGPDRRTCEYRVTTPGYGQVYITETVNLQD